MRFTAVAVVAILVHSAACFRPPEVTEAQLDRGCVILLPGVEGNAWQLEGVYHGLRAAGCDLGIEIIPWGSLPLSSLSNLIDIAENRRRACRIARRITTLRASRPDVPITLIGFSGGGGLAVLTLEALDEGMQVDRAILIAGAISNRYDIDRVLPRCRDGLVNIYSRRDAVVGAGTSLFGTIDRVKTVSAGHSGFVDADRALRKSDNLRQIEWTPEWLRLGHGGGHLGYLSRDWARQVLAPLVVARRDGLAESDGDDLPFPN